MQRQAADDLRRLVTDGLVEAGLTYEGAKAFATPRRLALTVHGVTARSADVREEKKGPRVGAPEKAIEGFLRGAGLASIDQAKIQSDPKKGDFYVATVTKPGRAAEEIVADAGAGGDPRLSLAEIDALGRALGAVGLALRRRTTRRGRRASAGCARSARSSARSGRRRRSRSSCDSRSPASPPATSPTAIASWPAASRSASAASTITCRRSRRRRSCSTPSGGRRSSRRRRRTSPSRRGWRWSRTRGCWRRWRGWSNGRSC